MSPQFIDPPAIRLPERTYKSIEEWFKETTKYYSVDWHQRYNQGLVEALKRGYELKN